MATSERNKIDGRNDGNLHRSGKEAMKKNSGEILTAVLIGLAVGVVASLVGANNYAQQRANLSGVPVGLGAYYAEKPMQAIGLPVLGAAAGWGVGALIEDDNDKDEPKIPTIQIQAQRDVIVTIAGRDGATVNEHTATTTMPAPAPAVTP